ncbi:MAG: hypothetical protein NC177_01930 [Ruminococcus flavefaciens]|nr:hypothetical protein [Ruminococcus flavefaciens]
MKTSGKNTLTEILIIVGDIVQILWEYFMLAISGTLAFRKWLLNDGSEIPVRIEINDIRNIAVTTLIFAVLVFLPYGLTKCLYWWYYEGKNVSERWIKPSFVISIVTVVLYIFVGISAFV